jgi:hypothetical protein
MNIFLFLRKFEKGIKMFIEFAVGKNSTSKQKGDLLENLAKKVLENQFYKVEKEIRRTGMELDLLLSLIHI